jgi:hypothetical protein
MKRHTDGEREREIFVLLLSQKMKINISEILTIDTVSRVVTQQRMLYAISD